MRHERRRRTVAGALMLSAVLTAFAGCMGGISTYYTLADLNPDPMAPPAPTWLRDWLSSAAQRATITGRTYDEIWAAAVKVADEHFEIREQDQARGVIKAERTMTFWGDGAWVGIYITPPLAGPDDYVVEVVSLKKVWPNLGEQNWEKKVLRNLQDVLVGRPIR